MQLIGAGERHSDVRDALPQQEARVGPGQALGLDLARAGADERAVAEWQRALARAGMRVAGEAERAALAHEAGGGVTRLRAVLAQQRGDVDLQQRAILDVRL